MIDRTFDGEKYVRTYVGGSKQAEKEYFKSTQGVENDNSDCNWFAYKNLLTKYFDDKLHVMLSWELLVSKLSFVVLIISVFLYNFPIACFIALELALFLLIISLVIKRKKENERRIYDFCLSVTLNEIKRISGLS